MIEVEANGDFFNLVVGEIYEASVGDKPWSLALSRIGNLLGRGDSYLLLYDPRDHRPLFAATGDRIAPEAVTAYDNLYGAIDPRAKAIMELPVGAAFACHERFDSDYVRRSEFYNDFLLRHGYRYAVGQRLFEAGTEAAFVGIQGNLGREPYGPRERELLERVAPHLARAVRLHAKLARLGALGGAFAALVERFPVAAIVADAAGRVVICNREAEGLLAAGDGLGVRAGVLAASSAAAEGSFRRLLAEATKAGGARGGGLSLPRPSDRRPLAVEAAPLAASSPACVGWERLLALVVVADPERRPTPLGRRLVELFGLTPAEARLAAALTSGKRLEEAAAERGVRLTTAKSQLRAVLQKTGTRRQAELVGLLARLPAAAPLSRSGQ